MHYLPLSDDAARQAIDASTVWRELSRVRQQARPYGAGMYWKKEGAYEYLVKTRAGHRQERLGARSAETERVYANFHERKRILQARLHDLTQSAELAARLNKAVKAGRVPTTVIDVLNAVQDAGLDEHFTVVGTHALYAYEAAAGVRIVQGALATQDVDLLWDARKRVRFMAHMARLDKSVLQVLKGVDPTFERKDMHNETAINSKGFEVDFLRRMAEGDDPHPFRFSAAEEELWPVQAERAQALTEAPRFEQVVIGVTGRMATMRTIAPQRFVSFKRWLAAKADRDPLKRRRDGRQADIVQALLDEGLLLA